MNPSSASVNYPCKTVDQDWSVVEASVVVENSDLYLMSGKMKNRLGPANENSLRTVQRLKSTRSDVMVGDDLRGFLPSPSCGIIEVIDECEVRCSTCIANSLPGTGNSRSIAEISVSANLLSARNPNAPLMLSGGEPTLHRSLLEIVSQLSTLPNPLYLITNGIKLAANPTFANELKSACPSLTIYLQYDSTSSSDIHALRTPLMSFEQREKAVAACERAKLPYVLVSVIAKGVNDDKLGSIFDRHFNNTYLKGLTFQPIKMVGRNEFASAGNALTRFDVDELVRDQIGFELFDHPENFLNWSTVQFVGEDRRSKAACGSLYDPKFSGKHITVVWHTSRSNYVVETCAEYPVMFFEGNKAVPLEIHYG